MAHRDDDLVTVVKGKPRRRGEMIPLSMTAAEARQIKRIRIDAKKRTQSIACTRTPDRKSGSRIHCCRHCGKNLLDKSLDRGPREAMNFCLHCGGDIRTQNAVCKCGYVYFDGLRDRRLLGRFCAGCGRSLSKALKGLPQ